jgi:hypothetical protein
MRAKEITQGFGPVIIDSTADRSLSLGTDENLAGVYHRD